MRSLKTIAHGGLSSLKNTYLSAALPEMEKKLTARNAQRPSDGFRWFTSEEAKIAEALATLIIPSDDDTPGIAEVEVFGPPAIVALDNLVARALDKQQTYAVGLLAFDTWALKERKHIFAELSEKEKIALLKAAQKIYDGWKSSSPMRKVSRKVEAMAQARNGSFLAAQLYPVIRDDCLIVFYTNRASWTWLEYDGPPMDKGYTNLAEPR